MGIKKIIIRSENEPSAIKGGAVEKQYEGNYKYDRPEARKGKNDIGIGLLDWIKGIVKN